MTDVDINLDILFSQTIIPLEEEWVEVLSTQTSTDTTHFDVPGEEIDGIGDS